jgi:hypothetical protein
LVGIACNAEDLRRKRQEWSGRLLSGINSPQTTRGQSRRQRRKLRTRLADGNSSGVEITLRENCPGGNEFLAVPVENDNAFGSQLAA